MSAASWLAEAGVKASMFGAGVFATSAAFGELSASLATLLVAAVIGALADVFLARVAGVVRERRRSPRDAHRFKKP